MNNLRRKIRSYHVTSYEVLFSTLEELLTNNDVTYISLWLVLFIVVLMSSLIILLKRKHDTVFSQPEVAPPELVNRYVDIIHSEDDSSKFINYKKLLAQLHHTASRCYDTCYASKCIRLVRDCPYLVNVSLEPSGLTPFQLVCYNGHTCLVEYMLAKGANPWLATQSGENALCLAVYHYLKHPESKDLSCLDVLFNSGCTLDPNSRCFKVILKMATQGCHKRLTEWILVHTKAATYDYRSMSVPLVLENIQVYSKYKPSFRH
ncbi:uncharacterized protein LOC124306516 isoform X1 [Neodiprion virginianus]|uniref:uncharacterized protein LOC124306516 isoform X1 n=1 Tax=Neodiprion virginianus TaxID=2961670 RepID=UPI001EE7274C|nr:uncharacterized protein LOC124306516 isoform X1 [Neodiprion virginianus]